MRSFFLGSAVVCIPLLACNAIVGVEDVQRAAASGGAGGQSQGGGGAAAGTAAGSGGAGQGGTAGAAGDGGGAAGAAGGPGGGGAGEGGAAGNSGQAGAGGQPACGPGQGPPWESGAPLDRVTLTLVQDLTAAVDGAFQGPHQPRGVWGFMSDGQLALRVGAGGLVRYTRDPQDGALTPAYLGPFASMAGGLSLLYHPWDRAFLVGGSDSLTGDGQLQLYAYDGSTQQVSGVIDSSKLNGALATLDFSDVRSSALHPLNRWIYAAFARDTTGNKSQIALLEILGGYAPPTSGYKLALKQTVTESQPWSAGLMISPDGEALYVGASRRLFRHPLDPYQGTLGAPEEVAFPQGDSPEVRVSQGVVCQRGEVHHVYAPVTSEAPGGQSQVGLWHSIHAPGKAAQSLLYGTETSAGLARASHAVASKDCSRLFVVGSAFTGDATFKDGFTPVLHVFTVHPQTGALALESSLTSGKDFQAIVRDPLLALSPDERHLYVSGEWIDNVSVFRLDRAPAGAVTDPLALRVSPGQFLQAWSYPTRGELPFREDCPPGQLLRGFTGLMNTTEGFSYGRRLARIGVVCGRVTLLPTGQPPSLQLSSGYTSPVRGNWGLATEPWSNLCPAGHVVVGSRPLFLKDADGQARLMDIELQCAPLSLPCALPYQPQIGAAFTKATETNLPAGVYASPQFPVRACLPGMAASGARMYFGDVVENMGLNCSSLSFVVSPQECQTDTDCPAPGRECTYAACVQGHCQEQAAPLATPTRRQNATCNLICRSTLPPGETLIAGSPPAPHPDVMDCMTCSDGQATPTIPTPASCDFLGGSVCAPNGGCVVAW